MIIDKQINEVLEQVEYCGGANRGKSYVNKALSAIKKIVRESLPKKWKKDYHPYQIYKEEIFAARIHNDCLDEIKKEWEDEKA